MKFIQTIFVATIVVVAFFSLSKACEACGDTKVTPEMIKAAEKKATDACKANPGGPECIKAKKELEDLKKGIVPPCDCSNGDCKAKSGGVCDCENCPSGQCNQSGQEGADSSANKSNPKK